MKARLKQFLDSLNFTSTERIVVLSLVGAFIVGLGIRLFNNDAASPRFDYSASDAEFGDRYRVVLANSHLHDDEYRRIARAEILEQKVKDKIKEQTPATLTQARLEVISLPDEPSARAARERVLAGEDWATVAKEVSLDSNVAETGGVKDYAPQGSFPPAYDDFAFSAPIGEISDVRIDPSQEMTNATSFYVVRVVDRVDRALTDEQRPSYESLRWRHRPPRQTQQR